MIKNKLKEAVRTKCTFINLSKRKRERKWKITFELEEIAKKLNVSISTVWVWYYDKANPRGDNFMRLPAYFGISVDDFYFDSKLKKKLKSSKK